MRHNKKINHLGRTNSHRRAMLANMASSLIEHKRITTTVAKAKALRMYVEPLITKAKEDTTHSRRIVFSYLQNKHAVSELFREVAAKIADRPGGYTRILKTGNRLGDNADMCIIELVDYNETMLAAKEEAAKPKRRRSRRGGKKTETTAPIAETSPITESEEKEVKTEDAESSPEEQTEIEEPIAEAKTEVKSDVVSDEDAREEPTEEEKPEKDSKEEKKEE